MNQKFDELMYRSGLTAQGCWDSMDDYDREAIMKFAELIVQECVLISRTSTDGFSAGRRMQEYFGVE